MRTNKSRFELTNHLRELRDFSFATFLIERVFFFLQYLSLANLLFRTRTAVHESTSTEEEMRVATIRRGRRIDIYVFLWFLMMILCSILAQSTSSTLKFLAVIPPLYRVFDIMQVAVNMVIFDHLRTTRKHRASGITRTLTLGLWNYVEIVICFGVYYAAMSPFQDKISSWADAYYFSAITQLTIGYGDIKPVDIGRAMAATQGILGVLYIILVITTFVSLLPKINPVQAGESQNK